MNARLITPREIAERQHSIRIGYQRSHTSFTVAGIRRLIGNTIIAMGTMIHGTRDVHHPVAPPLTAV